MDERRWERLAVLSGPLFIACVVVSLAIGGSTPKPEDPVETIRRYILDKRTEILTQGVLFGLGAAALIWFFGTLRAYLRRSEESGRLSGIMFGGGLVIVGLAFVTAFFNLALAYKVASTAEPGVVQAMWDATIVGGVMFGFPSAVVTGATSLLVLRTRAFAQWIGWLGLLVAAANLAGVSQMFYTSGSWAPGGSASFIPFLVVLVWVLVVSVALTVKLKPSSAGA